MAIVSDSPYPCCSWVGRAKDRALWSSVISFKTRFLNVASHMDEDRKHSVKFADETKLEGLMTSGLQAQCSLHSLALPSQTEDCASESKLEQVWVACSGISWAPGVHGLTYTGIIYFNAICFSWFFVLSVLFPLSTHLLAVILRLWFKSYSAKIP